MTNDAASSETRSIKAMDALSAHRITSGQVVIDLQTAVKELVENSLDAGATSIEVRFKDHGLDSIEVIDNGTGIASADYDVVALKHHTSKLSSFEDLSSVTTFGFRGEALASLCALSGSVTIATATASTAPVGTILELDRLGRVSSRNGKLARQKGTTVTISGIFKPLPVRRKEFERNAKREFGKALNLLNAYALVPCSHENGGVRLVVSNQLNGRRSVQLRTDGCTSLSASISTLWGPKTLENLVELDLAFEVETEKSVLRRQNAGTTETATTKVVVRGMISKFTLNCGRSTSDRQFLFINGRPCSLTKVQKAFNEIYRTFNAAQAPFVAANFTLPNGSHDINVSPDKRTIFIHSEDNLVQTLKAAMEEHFAPERSTYAVRPTQTQTATSGAGPASRDITQKMPAVDKGKSAASSTQPGLEPLFLQDEDTEVEEAEIALTLSQPELDIDMNEPQLLIEGNASETLIPPAASRSPGPVAALSRDKMRPSMPNLTTASRPEGLPQVDTSEFTSQERPASPAVTLVSSTRVDGPARSQRDDRPSLTRHVSSTGDSDSPPIPSLKSAVAHGNISTVMRTSFNNVSRVSKKDPTQLVLSTSGAAWNLRRAAGTEGLDRDTPRKRARLSHDDAPIGDTTAARRSSKLGFRAKIASHALPGSQMVRGESEEEDANENDQEMDEVAVEEESEMVARSQGSSQQNDGRSNSPEPGAADATPETSTDRLEPAAPDSNISGSPKQIPIEIVKAAGTEVVDLHFDLSATSSTWRRLGDSSGIERATKELHVPASSLAQEAGIDVGEDNGTRIEEALSRVITKDDFASMEILGQFNLGFIIVRRYGVHAGSADSAFPVDDLFIVDQHAADEKYNFETLQQTTKINSQALIRPKLLELTASDELLALENIDILRQNGFEIDTEGGSEEQGESRRRLRLVAQPVSKSTVFDIKDLEELLHLLRDRPRGQMVRCSKARAMFASRACRKSVMVGMPLKTQQMTAIVRHMGTMDQPWNCPHGRPTMRHLSDISSLGRDHLSDKRPDWQVFTQD